mmetsp:Transcript_28062/g.41886  ORF Transcript_28062/g.41886 Transcript_28062/m.41886 type:complete len:158 (-) Transcript_28062:2720-3193(-)
MSSKGPTLTINSKTLLGETTPDGFNRTKRKYARLFLWLTSLLLLTSHPLLSLVTSTCAVYTMHGGTWFSHKNFKWMTASIISFCISLYSLTLSVESNFVDEERAYELKAVLEMKHRAAEMIWGGILLLCLGLTVKEQIDGVVARSGSMVVEKNKKQT